LGWIVYWAVDLGVMCKSCFDDATERPPEKVSKSLLSDDERKAISRGNLSKAREARSAKAKERAQIRAEKRERRRAENPEAYDAMMAKRMEGLKKAREVQKAKKELTPDTA